MDVTKMLADLRREHAVIQEAIIVLERMAQGRGKRRGRPPAWMAKVKAEGTGATVAKRRGTLRPEGVPRTKPIQPAQVM